MGFWNKLNNSSDRKKKIIAFITAFFVTLLIVVFWQTTRNLETVGFKNDTLNPFSSIKDSISKMASGIGSSLGDLAQSLNSINEIGTSSEVVSTSTEFK